MPRAPWSSSVLPSAQKCLDSLLALNPSARWTLLHSVGPSFSHSALRKFHIFFIDALVRKAFQKYKVPETFKGFVAS